MKYDENIQAIAKETAEAYGAHIVPSGCITSAMVTIRRIQGAVAFALCESGWDADCADRYLKEQGWLPEDEKADIPEPMSTERLTPEEVLHAELLGHLQFRLREKILDAMRVYAAQEVEHKTKQLREENEKLVYSNSVLGKAWHRINEENKRLREERQNILESLFSIRDMVHGTPWVVVNKLIDQLNQENEG